MTLELIGYILLGILTAGTIVVILSDEDQYSSKKVSWIIIVVLIPVFGLICYLIFGLNPRRDKKFEKKFGRFASEFNKAADDEVRHRLFSKENKLKIREDYQELAELLSHSNGTTVTDDNNLEIITSGHRKLEALLNDLENARDHIHMEYFYFRKDNGSKRIKEMLMKKAREGVKVRFIHENIANIAISPHYYNEMKKAGVEIVKFTKPRINIFRFSAQLNYRDHRKIVVIDGKIGYTGGMNIGDDYFLRWRDTHMRITGNAVSALQYSFMYSYFASGGHITGDFHKYFPKMEKVKGHEEMIQIVPDEPDTKWPILHMGTVWAVQHCSKYIYIQTPYFVPPEPLLQALKSAALKGVDIRLMLPHKSDSRYMEPANRSFYKECLEAGIRIFEKTGNFIHSKTIVSDDYLSIIGTANMDYRSLELNYEINAYIYSETTAKKNEEIFLKDLEECIEIDPEEWKHRKWYKKMTQAVVRLFSPLL